MIRLLVPVDGSEAAVAAVRHAAFLFREGSVEEVVLLNVQEPLEQGRPAAFHSLAELRELERRQGEWALNRACDILDDSEVRYSAVIGVGAIVPTIARAAEVNRCDGIVLATTFWSRLKACFGGGLPARLMRRTPVPVTMVRAPHTAGRTDGGGLGPGRRHAHPPVVVYPALS